MSAVLGDYIVRLVLQYGQRSREAISFKFALLFYKHVSISVSTHGALDPGLNLCLTAFILGVA